MDSIGQPGDSPGACCRPGDDGKCLNLVLGDGGKRGESSGGPDEWNWRGVSWPTQMFPGVAVIFRSNLTFAGERVVVTRDCKWSVYCSRRRSARHIIVARRGVKSALRSHSFSDRHLSRSVKSLVTQGPPSEDGQRNNKAECCCGSSAECAIYCATNYCMPVTNLSLTCHSLCGLQS